MENLVKLVDFTLDELGNLAFSFQINKDFYTWKNPSVSSSIVTGIKLENENFEVTLTAASFNVTLETWVFNPLSSEALAALTGKSFTINNLNIVSVSLDENDILDWFAYKGITECTKPYVTTRMILYNLTPLRVKALKFYNVSSCCECDLPLDFINAILQIEALEISIKVNDVETSVDLFKKITGNIIKSLKGCGCHVV